ncbi:T9SS type A sorting domain-containing protein [Pontibacter roseus]|uniref:T9SS type A sorting domain-containing protein n=1 Tax=Pontibacter roseus TaxID=336989 RepID=UPI00037499EB|nr:T9SS type A sorting domain-containing protein [Pontibacter roseus]
MKTYLRAFSIILVLMLCQQAVWAQAVREPTLDSTLDNIETIKVNTPEVFNLFVRAFDRSDEPVQIRMRLNDPAQRNLIALEYNLNPDAPDFVEAAFDEEGVAILGDPEEFLELQDTTVYLRITVSEPGTYRYTFDLLRADLNPISPVSESVVVATTLPASIRSSLNLNPTLVKGADTEFDVVLRRGETAANTPVYLRMTLNNPAQASRVALQYQDGQQFKPLAFNQQGVASYGPEAGFPLTDQTLTFRANFADAVNYGYKLEIVRRADNSVLATREEVASVLNVAGIDDQLGDEQVKVYPTMVTNGYVVLELGQVYDAQVQVLDALGRTMLTADRVSGYNRLSTAGFARGLYFIKVIKDTEVASGRFIVQ